MPKIQALTPTQKSENQVYCRKLKSVGSASSLLRNFQLINMEERPAKYYLIDGEVKEADDYTTNRTDINKKMYDFIGHGRHVGSETEDGKLDNRLLRFYNENPDKIPDFHKSLFETLTAPKAR